MAAAFVESFTLVTFAEMGDKTQLLSIILAAKFRRHIPVLLGILLATLINHGFTAWLGSAISGHLDPRWMNIGAAVMLIVTGLWTLIPDDEPDFKETTAHGAFAASFIAFFLAEMGDKTQLATLTLGAHYSNTLMVIAGTTAGMMAANIPAVLCGQAVIKRLPMELLHRVTCVLFVSIGIYGLIQAL